jgi:hypothetical protein
MELLALLILLGILAFYVTLPSNNAHMMQLERPLWPWKLIPHSTWDPHTAPSNARIAEPSVQSSVRPWGSHGRTAQGVHHF